jgi:hypothetical protein
MVAYFTIVFQTHSIAINEENKSPFLDTSKPSSYNEQLARTLIFLTLT